MNEHLSLLPRAANAFSQLRGRLPLAAFAALFTMLSAYEILKRRDSLNANQPEPNSQPAAHRGADRCLATEPSRSKTPWCGTPKP
jgi:hypothetical protein